MFLSPVENLSRQSHAKVKIKCQFNLVDNCSNIKELEYRTAMDNIERNNGKYICFNCSRNLKFSGTGNPNSKYNIDINYFKNIDSDDKAYFLGWIASDGHIGINNSIIISIRDYDINCLENLKNMINPDIIIKNKENMVVLTLNSKKMCDDVCNWLKVSRGKKSDLIKFPNLSNDNLKWAFLRGFFDGDGHIRNIYKKSTPECSIASDSKDLLLEISNFSKIPNNIYRNQINFNGINAIDFLGKIYENSGKNKLKRKYEMFNEWLLWKKMIRGKGLSSKLPECYVFKTDKNAILPNKKRISDVGYDLTIIKVEKQFNENTFLYDTGIKIKVKPGLYAEIVPRSSLSKSGYMLANSIGIIDPSYNGNLFIALTKIDKKSPDLTLPFRCCQLIFKEQIHIDMIEVCEDLEETERGSGGFGSTGK